MIQDAEMYLKLISTIIVAFFAYHKFIMSQLDKKVDKDSCKKETEYRNSLQRESNKAIKETLADIKEKLKKIEDYILQNKK